ncbi:MAG: phospholipid transport system substrate-binding protein [Oleiphilaceae bacterium]|jgi:phospholipid transport system substrate-binding protein
MLSNSAYADTSQEELVRERVERSVVDLLETFESERQYYDSQPDRFFKNMDVALSKIVDFRRIAGRVMGKYAKRASKEQRNNFVEVFKKSLYITYTKTLIESGVFKINVTKANINSRSDKRANVNLDVISDNGTVFPVLYSMHKNKQDLWLVENVVVFGVNIGLAFRDRFETQMRKNKNDVNAVIGSWTVNLDINKPKKEG